MRNANAGMRVLLVALMLLAIGHWAYCHIPTASKKAQVGKTNRRKTTRKARRLRRSVAVTTRATGPVYTVIATNYQAVASQTDRNPFVTADNTTIRRGYSSRLRWLAVSRDLLKQGGGRLHYGDRVRVGGVSPRLDGIYTVHDTMHKRHRHRIDILSNPREKLALSTRNVKLRLVMPVTAHKQPAKTKKPALAARRAHRGRPVATRPVRGHHRGRAGRAAYLTAVIL